MPRNRAREALNSLWTTLNDSTIAEGSSLTSDMLESMKITLRSFDIECLDDPEDNMSQTPPVRFLPLSASCLVIYPATSDMNTSTVWYDLPDVSRPQECMVDYHAARMVFNYVEKLGLGLVRANLPISLVRHQGLARMSYPDPFLLYSEFSSNDGRSWSVQTILESAKQNGLPTDPHITMMIYSSSSPARRCSNCTTTSRPFHGREVPVAFPSATEVTASESEPPTANGANNGGGHETGRLKRSLFVSLPKS